jgi:hypothetical protein
MNKKLNAIPGGGLQGKLGKFTPAQAGLARAPGTAETHMVVRAGAVHAVIAFLSLSWA